MGVFFLFQRLSFSKIFVLPFFFAGVCTDPGNLMIITELMPNGICFRCAAS
jgi:hypothetical protein